MFLFLSGVVVGAVIVAYFLNKSFQAKLNAAAGTVAKKL